MTVSIPPTMRGIRIDAPGGPEVLRPAMVDTPVPRDGELLIRVAAAGVNRPDILQRLGQYPVPPDADPLPGLEVAGTVAAVGAGVGGFGIGDRVMALTHGGGYAEFCRVHASHCLPVPEVLSLEEAAGVPETFFTVHYNVFMRAGLEKGESLLVHGGSSGIGTTAIQLAVAAGASVIATAGSDEKCRFCESLGAARAINYRDADWEAEVVEWSEGRGVDVVLDMVAGSYMQRNMNVLARDGRYVIIAFLEGSKAELDMRIVLAKRLTITGSTLRPQSTGEKGVIAGEVARHILPLLESGSIRPIVFRTFPLDEADEAHRLMESSVHKGKIVLLTAHGE